MVCASSGRASSSILLSQPSRTFYPTTYSQSSSSVSVQVSIWSNSSWNRLVLVGMKLAAAVCFFSCVWLSDCAPPTCYSRALGLSKEVMALLDKIHTYHRTVSSITIWTQLHWAASHWNEGVFSVSENVCCGPAYDLPWRACKFTTIILLF